jgi:hypothetical protein
VSDNINLVETLQPIVRLRDELRSLRHRYDHGAVSEGVYAAIRKIEIDIAWTEYRRCIGGVFAP